MGIQAGPERLDARDEMGDGAVLYRHSGLNLEACQTKPTALLSMINNMSRAVLCNPLVQAQIDVHFHVSK